MFFQRAEIWGFSVMIDYWPRRLDIAALKAGSLAEVTWLAPEIATFKWVAVCSLTRKTLATWANTVHTLAHEADEQDIQT